MAYPLRLLMSQPAYEAAVAGRHAQAVRLAQGFKKYGFDSCGKSVSKIQAMPVAKRGSVFHVQRMLSEGLNQLMQLREGALLTHSRNNRLKWSHVCLAGTALAVFQGFLTIGHAEDKECINFYTVGDSKCEPATKATEPSSNAPTLLKPTTAKSDDQKVDEYLENYGKPPREFVEFYMNPTPDNAKKWVEAYQGIVQKSQDLSKMWEDAERLYTQQGAEPALRRPATVVPAVTPQPTTHPQPAVTVPSAQASPLGNFGGLNAVPVAAQTGGVMPQDQGLKLTYYFSQVCPYCARMTPELSVLTNNYSGKLEFTCVDVTPFSGATAPNPAYLRDKLACQWRLPGEGELQREGVNQTPTLLVQQGGKAQVKLSGYMSQEQLKPYFAR
ncbi:MAG: conjugal transfer protein TraF [Blastochloris viridis]|uniref:Conjugal transfer protein TraF n=1 Tax=Blastochloris viridis TaxID=1079 RepID=A0A6N4R0N7_BLAVI|nr:MAG: conjugal transfer protein TraF [Blastochloris viridis]